MSALNGKKVLLGITGSIAAYKSAYLTRLLIKSGAEVQVLMTEAATRFISPLTLSTLSRRPVFTEVSSEEGWNNHVELGLWADAYLIAPATANTLSHLANGLCDNMLTAVYLSARCPVLFAPAMDLDMWQHPATRRNVDQLLSYGDRLIPVGHGELASGLVGDGRMAEPEVIVDTLVRLFDAGQMLRGKRVLITAGPTHEAIDPVRFIGNRSSGKMGIALAEAALAMGAEVDLVLGPVAHSPSGSDRLQVHHVGSAREMHERATALFPLAQLAILAAAVADFRPREAAGQKLKKGDATSMTLELIRNPDIAATLGKQKKPQQVLVGFALETQDALENARRKREGKNLDLIVLNTLEDPGAGFGHDTNRITLLGPDNKPRRFELKSKKEVAFDILKAARELLRASENEK